MQSQPFELKANIVDIVRKRVFPGAVTVENGRIKSVKEDTGSGGTTYNTTLMPGFVDAHIHIESSMLTPCQFARQAVVHGTVATISDPHEIANVLGVEGVRLHARRCGHTPLKIMFGAPSCVPPDDNFRDRRRGAGRRRSHRPAG
ncbi:MAG: amidohydrolase family protein [Phycisphaerales bacterium]